MDRLLAGAGGTLSLLAYDAAGALADVDGTNAPSSVSVQGSGGTEVLTPAGSRSSAGTYATTIPVSLTTLDLYTVLWTWPSAATRTTQFEVAGSFLFSDAELRAWDPDLTTAAYSAEKVRDARETAEDRFASVARWSFTRRGRREWLDGDGTEELFVAERKLASVTSVAIDGVALSAPELAELEVYENGKIVRPSGWTEGRRNVEILYAFGDLTPPAPVRDAGLRYARHLLAHGPFDDLDRATGLQTEAGFLRISQAAPGGKVGIPDIDAVLADYGRRGAGAFA